MKKETHIHPTAIVESGAKVGQGVTIEPYAIVKENVVLHDGVVIKSHAYIDGHTTIGENSVIWPSASIGTKTQDLKFKGEKTQVVIGKNCDIREFVTINSSCGEDTVVSVGDSCLIMAYCHVAHNCSIGSNVIMSNNATLAGHVEVQDFAVIGGLTPIHQFCRIGTHAMVGGMSRVPHDIPPYTIGGGVPYKFGGINLVGLKRRGFSLESRNALSKAYKFLYRSSLKSIDALKKIKQELDQTQEILNLINFIEESQRGILGLQGVAVNDCRGQS